MSDFGLGPPKGKLAKPVEPRNRGPALSKRTRLRIAEIEERLSKGETTGDISRSLVDTHGVLPRTVRRWVRSAELRWAGESDASGRAGRRAQLRAVAWKGVRLAFERKGLALDKMGGEHTYGNPDVGAAGRLLEFIARLDGDLTQPNSAIVVGFGDEAMAAIAKIYGGGAPELPAGEIEVEATLLPSERGE